MESRATYWVTYLLIAANLAMFAFELASGASPGTPTPQQMIDLGGNFAPLTMHGEPWRLVSAMFLHYGVLHIALNMVCLYQGRVVEKLFGHAGFTAVYVVAGLLGGVLSMIRATNVVSAGASGAIFGIYGAFGAFLVFRRATMPDEVWGKTAKQIGTFVAINLVYGLSVPGIDMSAHIGGLIAGFAVAAGLLAGQRADAQRVVRAVALTVVGVAITAAAVFGRTAPVDITGLLKDFATVESACLESYQTLSTQHGSGALTDAQYADKLDHDVIAPWRDVRKKIEAIQDPPERIARLIRTVVTYVETRDEAWSMEAEAMRLQGDARTKRLADLERKNAEVERDVAAITNEADRLKIEKP